MKVSLNWLKDFVDIDIPHNELAEKLLSVGFEVEEVIVEGQEVSKVVVGKIVSIEKHPNADSLQVCRIDVGTENGGIIQILTAAKNVFAGALVPVSLVGATLVGGTKISLGNLRGLDSYGMLCSGKELGITNAYYDGAEVDGILILSDTAKIGADIKSVVGLDDVIFDIGVTANRPDCQSIYGIAREVAAILKKPLKPLSLDYNEDFADKAKNHITVEVKNSKLCNRYMAKVVKNIKIEASPKWMQKRLASLGINSINNIVDITNYILLELGQPMHAFDGGKIGGSVVVRNANEGESVVILNGDNKTLKSDMLVIASSSEPIAIAGVMGGLKSGITNETDIIVFESAKFARDSVRKTSRTLNLRSDSSSRFEKGIDTYITEIALKRALNLVSILNCGQILHGEFDIKGEISREREIVYEKDKIFKLLGIDVPTDICVQILNSLQIKTIENNGVFTSIIPAFREDIDGYADIAEEIIRYYGYQHIVPTLLSSASVTKGGFNYAQKTINDIKTNLAQLGLNEIITYSFISPKFEDKLNLTHKNDLVKLLNPLGEDLSVMRTTLMHSMLLTLESNFKKKNESVNLFEVAKVYLPSLDVLAELPEEVETLSIGIVDKNKDFYFLKGIFELLLAKYKILYSFKRSDKTFLHPGRSIDVYIGDNCVGCFGEVYVDVLNNYDISTKAYYGELNLEYLKINKLPELKYKNIGKYPSAPRDLAIVVDKSVAMGDITAIITDCSKDLLEELKLFDIYEGEQVEAGKKSLAFSLKFRSVEKTLSDKEVEDIIGSILANISSKLGGKIR